MIVQNLPALQVVLPLIAAPICSIIPSKKLSWFIASAVSILTLVISLSLAHHVLNYGTISYEMGGWKAPFGIEYKVDYLNSFILVVLSGVASVTSLYAYSSVRDEIEKSKQSLFYSLYLLCFAGLLGITISNDLFNIYVFLEISSLATYALIATGKDRRALFASFEYLILGTIGATFILIGIGMLYMMTGSLNITDLSLRIPSLIGTLPVKVAISFLIAGLALKIAIFPLHIWLTNSYTNAPSFISAFLSATATKVSIYVFIKIFFTLFGYKVSFNNIPLDKLMMTLAITAIIIGSLAALMQNNIKRMLAYSSVAQIGYIILAISLISKGGMMAALIFIFNHAIAKSALFMAVGCVALRAGGVRISDFAGIGSKMPFTMGAFIVAGLSLVGIPLTGGFISKWYLLNAIYDKQSWLLFATIILTSMLALAYVLRIVEVAYFRESTNSKVREAPLTMLIPLWIMTLGVLIFGIYTQPIIELADKAATFLFSL